MESRADYVLDLGSSIIAQDTANAFHISTHFIADFGNKAVVKSTVQREADLVRNLEGLIQADLPIYDFMPPTRQPPKWVPQAKFDFHVLADAINTSKASQTFGTVFVTELGNSLFASFWFTAQGKRDRHQLVSQSLVLPRWEPRCRMPAWWQSQ